MASSGTLSEVFHTIVETKCWSIKQQRTNFDDLKRKLLTSMSKTSGVQENIRILLEAIKEIPAISEPDSTASQLPANLEKLVEQSKWDSSISRPMIQQWEGQLRSKLDAKSMRLKYASVYGKLIQEWLSDLDQLASKATLEGDSLFMEQSDRAEVERQRREWKDYVFRPLETDQTAIRKYLNNLFSTQQSKDALSNLRTGVKDFEETLKLPKPIDQKSIMWCVIGLIRSDLLTDKKREALQAF